MHTEIFRCLAGSHLYGTSNADSDHDYKAVHLPTKSEILLGRGKPVINQSTGSQDSHNTAGDVDVESFTLQRFLKLASDMQTIPVEMLFVADHVAPGHYREVAYNGIWMKILANKDKILNRNTKSFVGYCKGQAVRYSMRGKRLDTYVQVCDILAAKKGMRVKVWTVAEDLSKVEGVQIVPKPQPGGVVIDYLDVYGRQTPMTVTCDEAWKIYNKPVAEAGDRAKNARNSGGMDCKALYHAIRIANQGISLFGEGKIEFPAQDLPFLMKIRAGEVEIDEILDVFDEKLAILEGIGDNSPLADKPDLDWIDGMVADVHESIVADKL